MRTSNYATQLILLTKLIVSNVLLRDCAFCKSSVSWDTALVHNTRLGCLKFKLVEFSFNFSKCCLISSLNTFVRWTNRFTCFRWKHPTYQVYELNIQAGWHCTLHQNGKLCCLAKSKKYRWNPPNILLLKSIHECTYIIPACLTLGSALKWKFTLPLDSTFENLCKRNSFY